MKKILGMMVVSVLLHACAAGGGQAQDVPPSAATAGGGQNMDYIYRSPSYQLGHLP